MGLFPVRRGGRVVEGAPLLRAYGSKPPRGCESLPLRHTARKFSTLSFRLLSQPRSGDSNPRYGKGGSTKSPKAILDDARVARRARAEGPSQSLPLRQSASKFSTFSFRLPRQPRSGDNARRAAPKGRGAERRV